MRSLFKILGVIAFIAAILIGLYIKNHFSEYRNIASCQMFKEFLNLSFSSTLQLKYKDTDHHMSPTIEIAGIKVDVSLDNTGFYDFIVVGDSLIKEQGQPIIHIYRNGGFTQSFKIDFGCITPEK